MTHPKVSIIILNWNGLEDTLECLKSLCKITYPNYNITVVDNGSQGDDVKILGKKFGDYIHIIENEKNYGYTGGNNIGIRYALAHHQPDYFLIQNNDTIVAPDFLNAMVSVAECNQSIGIVGPKVYYHDLPDRIHSAGVRINMWTGQTFPIGIKQIDAGQYDSHYEVDCVCGCTLLVRNEIIQNIGLFDDSYFCYWDETDYCIRAQRAGYKVVFAPEAKIWHRKNLKQKLFNKLPGEEKASSASYYFWARNRFRFMRKHASQVQYLSSLIYYFIYHFWVMSVVCLLYHRNIGQFFAFYRGTRDGLLNSDTGAKIYRND